MDSDPEEVNFNFLQRQPRPRQFPPTPPPAGSLDLPDDPINYPDFAPSDFKFLFVRNFNRCLAYPGGPIFPIRPRDELYMGFYNKECYFLVEAWLGKWKADVTPRPPILHIMKNLWWLRENGYMERFEGWSKIFCEKYSFALYARMCQIYYHQQTDVAHVNTRWLHDNDLDWMQQFDESNLGLPSFLGSHNDWFDDMFDVMP